MPKQLKVVVLISGGGTTLKNLIEKSAAGDVDLDFRLVISSNSKAGGLTHASSAGIPTEIVRKKDFATPEEHSEAIFSKCRAAEADYVVMGGYLQHVLIPADFENRVLNTHPALIPSFCGKGFYGQHVHQAVLDYGAKLSGCTIHFVDNQYDHGPIVLQKSVDVHSDDDAATLAARVFQAECEAYPEVLAMLAAGKVTVDGRRVSTGG